MGCELIQQGAILLKLPQTAAATGQILFQRYFYQKSFVRYHFEVCECSENSSDEINFFFSMLSKLVFFSLQRLKRNHGDHVRFTMYFIASNGCIDCNKVDKKSTSKYLKRNPHQLARYLLAS